MKELPSLRYDSVVEYGCEITRIFRLLKNDKTLLVTNEDMFSKIILTVSRIQKQVLGDSDIQVSDVLDAFNNIKRATLANDSKMSTGILDDDHSIDQSVANEYLSDLKGQNLIDPWGLYKKLEIFFKSAEDENEEAIRTIRNSNVLMVLPNNFGDPKAVDMHIAKLLFPEGSHQLNEVVLKGISEDDMQTSVNPDQSSVIISQMAWNDLEFKTKGKPPPPKRDESYNIQLFLGYLKLLTNTRDELSLAKIICGAGGILDHEAFNILKQESLHTKMPLYQV